MRTGGSHDLAAATLAWGFSLAALSVPSSAIALSIAITPTSDHPNAKIGVIGSGFSANAAIDIYFDTTDELLVFADANGRFTKRTFNVTTDALPGQHWVSALERDNGKGSQRSFTVTTIWAEHGFRASGKRFNPYENILSAANANRLDVAWAAPTGNFVWSSPVVANGIVYAGSDDKRLYALDTATGSTLWMTNVGVPFENAAAVANGILYVAALGTLYAFDAATGTQKWSVLIGVGAGSYSSPVIANGVVYVGSYDGNLYAYDANSGASKWNATTGNEITSSPAVANGLVYAGSLDGKVYAWNATTGANVWATPLNQQQPPQIYSSPAIADGRLFIGAHDSKLYALNANSGAILWSAATGQQIDVSSPATAYGMVFVGSFDGKLYAYKASNGALAWSATTGGAVNSSPEVANNTVYVGSGDGNFYAYDVNSGNQLLNAATGGPITTSSPAISDGMVFVGSLDQSIYAYALDGGNNVAYKNRRTQPPRLQRYTPTSI